MSVVTAVRHIHGGVQATHTRKYRDTVIWTFQVETDGSTVDTYTILADAQAYAGSTLPVRGALLTGSSLVADTFAMSPTDEKQSVWQVVVTFATPETGEPPGGQEVSNPLLRPPKVRIEDFTYDEVVAEAKNVEALPHGNGSAGQRNANTLGPITNAVGIQPDEPVVRSARDPVYVIERNYADPGVIESLNEFYAKTTNDGTQIFIDGEAVSERTLEFMGAVALGEQTENGVSYVTGECRVRRRKTTDLIINNVGWSVYSRNDDKVIRATIVDDDDNRVESVDPVNLDLDGFQVETPTSITYRFLEEKNYLSTSTGVPLLSGV